MSDPMVVTAAGLASPDPAVTPLPPPLPVSGPLGGGGPPAPPPPPAPPGPLPLAGLESGDLGALSQDDGFWSEFLDGSGGLDGGAGKAAPRPTAAG